jgi:hypothetical protein
MIRLVLLFLHVTSAMGIVAGLAIEGLVLRQFRTARTGDEARQALTSSRYAQIVAGPSMLVAILTGLYLATVYWSWKGAWMGVAILTIVAMALFGIFMTGRPMLRAMRGPADALGAAALGALQGRLSMSYAIRLGLLVGIVFLMTTKLASGLPAISAVVVVGAIGWVVGLSMRPRHGSRIDANDTSDFANRASAIKRARTE